MPCIFKVGEKLRYKVELEKSLACSEEDTLYKN